MELPCLLGPGLTCIGPRAIITPAVNLAHDRGSLRGTGVHVNCSLFRLLKQEHKCDAYELEKTDLVICNSDHNFLNKIS